MHSMVLINQKKEQAGRGQCIEEIDSNGGGIAKREVGIASYTQYFGGKHEQFDYISVNSSLSTAPDTIPCEYTDRDQR